MASARQHVDNLVGRGLDDHDVLADDDEVVAAVLGHHLDNFGRQRLEVHIAGHDRTHGQ